MKITFRRIAIFALIISACLASTYFLPAPAVLPAQTKKVLEPAVYRAEKVGNEVYKILK